ncbi:hypothetical protein FRC02_003501 [Tulasnella sp. 418]|nr:hypothetical protein FRC02_003501 [Tulasnella sp. 418]
MQVPFNSAMEVDEQSDGSPSEIIYIGNHRFSTNDHVFMRVMRNVVSLVDHPADLAALSLTDKAMRSVVVKRLYSGLFFPTIALSEVMSRWYVLNLLRKRPDLARHVRILKLTEGQETIESMPHLPQLTELTVEFRAKSELESGYHDHRLIEFLMKHSQVEEITLVGARNTEIALPVISLPNLRRIELHYSQLPNWLFLDEGQLTHLRLTGAKGRALALPTDLELEMMENTFIPAAHDPTINRFPDDSTLYALSPRLSGLSVLEIACCVDITAAGLSMVLQSVPRLTALAIHFCQKLDIASAISNQPRLPHLTDLTLNCKIRCGQQITTFSAYAGEIRSHAILSLTSPTPSPEPFNVSSLGILPGGKSKAAQTSKPSNPGDVETGTHLTSLTISGQTTLWERRILLPGFVTAHHQTLRKLSLVENMISVEELDLVCVNCQELEELKVVNPSDLHDPTLTPMILGKARNLKRVIHASGRYVVRRTPGEPLVKLVRV